MSLRGHANVVVLALPRGGVPVGYEVARALQAPLDVVMVRKLGVPGQPELAMGAIAGGEVCLLNEPLVRALRVAGRDVERVLTAERTELERREHVYRGTRGPLRIAGCTVILVDDGLATGATMSAAIEVVTRQGAAAVIVAVPVASRQAGAELTVAGQAVVAVMMPEPFEGVGRWYEEFDPTSDTEVMTLLSAGRRGLANECETLPGLDTVARPGGAGLVPPVHRENAPSGADAPSAIT